jgi:hypothetical protein
MVGPLGLVGLSELTRSVVFCGEGDASRGQTVRAHSRENGPAERATHDPLRPAQLQGSRV